METILSILFIFLAVIFLAFFSGSETALISLNRPKLKYLVETKTKEAIIINDLLANSDRLLASLLIGTNISVIIASALFTNMIVKNFGGNSEWVTTLVLVPIILIFGEIIPKAIFRQKADQVILTLVWPLLFFYRIFKPLVSTFSSIANSIIWLFGQGKKPAKSLFVTREELKHLIQESERQGVIRPRERSIVYKIFDFGTTKVKKIMVPFNKIISIDVGSSISDLKQSVTKTGFSKMPAFEKEPNNFIGIVNILDVLYNEGLSEDKLYNFVRPLLFISEDAVIDKVFFSMQLKKQSIAIVVNRDGKNIGMVTIKDLIEEIIGDT